MTTRRFLTLTAGKKKKAIFVWQGKMVFFSEEAEQASPEDRADMILRQHLCLFAYTQDDFDGFVAHNGGKDSPFVNHVCGLLDTFNEEQPLMPFSIRKGGDPQFRDLVTKMTYLDPSRRITAREALDHPWFSTDAAEM